MQVTETSTEGLKREFRVVVPATDLSTRVNDRLTQMKDQVKINGFRPGKVPVAHLKRVYGRAVMAETIDQMVRETNAKIVTDHGFKLAMDPKITMTEDKDEIEGVIEGKTDLAYTIALEVVPQITLADFKSIKLERLTTAVSEADIDDALDKIAAQNRPYAAKAEGSTAESGDRVTISFVGTIDGVPFEGGTGEDVPVIIGSNSFIPGFEEQLIGIASGESRTVNVTFPPNYASEQLAGKAAAFAVTAKSVESPGPVTVDDAFATSLGIESLARLREAVKERIALEHAAASRQKLKRALLDRLDAMHKFEAPPTLVEEEFKNVWNTVLADLKSQNRTFEDEGTTEEKAQRRIPRHCRPARAARPRPCGDRRKEQHQGGRRRNVARRGGTGPAISRAREGGVGLLSKESQRLGERAGADLRGKGGRLPGRTGRRHRKAGDQGRTLQGRRGRCQSRSSGCVTKGAAPAAAHRGGDAPAALPSAGRPCRHDGRPYMPLALKRVPVRRMAGTDGTRGPALPRRAGQNRLHNARSVGHLHELPRSHGGRADQPGRAGL